MSEESFEVVIPEERYATLTAEEDGLPAVMVVNANLVDWDPKVVFAWNLSLLFTLKEIKNGLPSKEEKARLYEFEDSLAPSLKGDPGQPNALWLATRNWNGRRELIYRVHNPELANEVMTQICRENTTPNPLHYEMTHDPEWRAAEPYFLGFRT